MWLNRNTGIRTHGSLLRLTLPPAREDVPTLPAHRRYAPVGRGAGSPDIFLSTDEISEPKSAARLLHPAAYVDWEGF